MIQRLLKILEQIENTAMAVFALVLIFAAAAQVLLRFFNVGSIWLDPVLRALVMWIAMLGALAATRHDKHINLDALTRSLSGWSLRAARLLTMLFAAAICLVMAKASYGLVQLDRESATPLVNDIPAWWVEVILPVGFGLMALRFALRAFVLPESSKPEAT